MRDTVLKQQPEDPAELIELKEPVELVEPEVPEELVEPVELEGPRESVEPVDSKESVEPVAAEPASEHGAVSVGSPTQSLPPNKGVMQARARDFLPHEQEGSQ